MYILRYGLKKACLSVKHEGTYKNASLLNKNTTILLWIRSVFERLFRFVVSESFFFLCYTIYQIYNKKIDFLHLICFFNKIERKISTLKRNITLKKTWKIRVQSDVISKPVNRTIYFCFKIRWQTPQHRL